jgi:hypothetical protein
MIACTDTQMSWRVDICAVLLDHNEHIHPTDCTCLMDSLEKIILLLPKLLYQGSVSHF